MVIAIISLTIWVGVFTTQVIEGNKIYTCKELPLIVQNKELNNTIISDFYKRYPFVKAVDNLKDINITVTNVYNEAMKNDNGFYFKAKKSDLVQVVQQSTKGDGSVVVSINGNLFKLVGENLPIISHVYMDNLTLYTKGEVSYELIKHTHTGDNVIVLYSINTTKYKNVVTSLKQKQKLILTEDACIREGYYETNK